MFSNTFLQFSNYFLWFNAFALILQSLANTNGGPFLTKNDQISNNGTFGHGPAIQYAAFNHARVSPAKVDEILSIIFANDPLVSLCLSLESSFDSFLEQSRQHRQGNFNQPWSTMQPIHGPDDFNETGNSNQHWPRESNVGTNESMTTMLIANGQDAISREVNETGSNGSISLKNGDEHYLQRQERKLFDRFQKFAKNKVGKHIPSGLQDAINLRDKVKGEYSEIERSVEQAQKAGDKILHKGEEIFDSAKNFVGNVKDVTQNTLNDIHKKAEMVKDTVMENCNSAIGSVGKAFGTGGEILGKLSSATNGAFKPAEDLLNKCRGGVMNFLNGTVKGKFGDLLNHATGTVADFKGKIMAVYQDTIGDAVDFAKGMFDQAKGVVNTVKETVKDAKKFVNNAVETFNDATKGAKKLLNNLKNPLKGTDLGKTAKEIKDAGKKIVDTVTKGARDAKEKFNNFVKDAKKTKDDMIKKYKDVKNKVNKKVKEIAKQFKKVTKISKSGTKAMSSVTKATKAIATAVKTFKAVGKLVGTVAKFLGPLGAAVGAVTAILDIFMPPGPSEEMLKLEEMDKKLDNMDAKLDNITDMLHDMSQKMDENTNKILGQIEATAERLENKIGQSTETIIANLSSQMDDIKGQISGVESQIKDGFNDMTRQFTELNKNMMEEFKKVHQGMQELTKLISKEMEELLKKIPMILDQKTYYDYSDALKILDKYHNNIYNVSSLVKLDTRMKEFEKACADRDPGYIINHFYFLTVQVEEEDRNLLQIFETLFGKQPKKLSKVLSAFSMDVMRATQLTGICRTLFLDEMSNNDTVEIGSEIMAKLDVFIDRQRKRMFQINSNGDYIYNELTNHYFNTTNVSAINQQYLHPSCDQKFADSALAHLDEERFWLTWFILHGEVPLNESNVVPQLDDFSNYEKLNNTMFILPKSQADNSLIVVFPLEYSHENESIVDDSEDSVCVTDQNSTVIQMWANNKYCTGNSFNHQFPYFVNIEKFGVMYKQLVVLPGSFHVCGSEKSESVIVQMFKLCNTTTAYVIGRECPPPEPEESESSDMELFL